MKKKILIILLSTIMSIVVCVKLIGYLQDKYFIYGLTQEKISAVVVQPNGDWPNIILDDEKDISAFIEWIDGTYDAPSTRSAPPLVVYDGEIQYENGERVFFQTSAILEPLANIEKMDRRQLFSLNLNTPRSSVWIKFSEFDEILSGSRAQLIKIPGINQKQQQAEREEEAVSKQGQ